MPRSSGLNALFKSRQLRPAEPRAPHFGHGQARGFFKEHVGKLFQSYGQYVTRPAERSNKLLDDSFRDYGQQPIPDVPEHRWVPFVIPFVIVATLNQRIMAVSQKIYGPAVIESVDFECNPVTNDSNASFNIYVAAEPDNTTAISPRPAGRDIFENTIISAGINAQDDLSGWPLTGQNAPRLILHHPLHIPVNLDFFYLKPGIVQTAGPVIVVSGTIRVQPKYNIHHFSGPTPVGR